MMSVMSRPKHTPMSKMLTLSMFHCTISVGTTQGVGKQQMIM